MLQRLDHRGGHYLLLVLVWAVVTLPNLGAPALWDVDEGNNGEAAREMYESGSFIVPTNNYQLRVDKPALLYWLQVACFSVRGVDEVAVRLPSALAAFAVVLLTYELGRRTFGATAGLLAGLMIASATLCCAAARFANPDALLDACTLLSFFLFWRGYRSGGSLPFAAMGIAAGLGMLAKGPVALVLPAAVSIAFLLWQRQLKLLAVPQLGWGVLTFVLVAAPWYTWVSLETKGEWLKGFFMTHNVGRALHMMENHGGSFYYYYIVILLVGFSPWSVFLGPAFWGVRSKVVAGIGGKDRDAVRFLLCWLAVYLLFFSIVSTKLPNYILPTYPAVALLTARSLDRWRRGIATLPTGLLRASLACLALVGIAFAAGLLIAAGILPAGIPQNRQLPGLAGLAAFGALPIAGALTGWWYLRRDARASLIGSVMACGVLFSAALAALGPVAMDRYKSPRALAAALPTDQAFRDVRLGSYEYFQPSLVFYCHREVTRLKDEASTQRLLEGPLPAFLFVPATVWDQLHQKMPGREIARHHDLYDGRDIVLVTND